MGYRLFSGLAGLLLAAALAMPGEAATPGANPFDQLNGDWKGGGTIIPSKGEPKKVTCETTYKTTGGNVAQTLHCTGNDYEVNTTLKLTYKNGKIKGSWNETVYDANGAVAGTAKDDTIHARITGDKFSGRMSIKTSAAGHTINILQLDEQSGTYRLATSLSFHH